MCATVCNRVQDMWRKTRVREFCSENFYVLKAQMACEKKILLILSELAFRHLTATGKESIDLFFLYEVCLMNAINPFHFNSQKSRIHS